MTPCPSDENLASLLNDALATAERDAIAEHIDKCASCLGKLARLSEFPGAWQPASRPQESIEEEELIVQRLKLIHRLSASSSPDSQATPTLDSGQAKPGH